MKRPININEMFKGRFVIGHDPAWEITPQSEEDREWLCILPCREGGKESHIYSHGFAGEGREFGYFGRTGPMRVRLLKIPGVTLHIQGDGEFIVIFPLSLFETIAEIVKPRRRRHLSDVERERTAKHWKEYHQEKKGQISPAKPRSGMVLRKI